MIGQMQALLSQLTIIRNDVEVEEVIHEMVKASENAFYVVNIGDIIMKFKQWTVLLPRVQPYYAVKCNTNPMVLEVLSALGTGFDCASKAELQTVLKMGISPHRIVYANPCKTNSYINFALMMNVRRMTFDNELELRKISRIFPDAELILRIRCDALEAQCPLGAKFGVNPALAPSLLRAAKDLGLNVIGVSFHVGSGCNDITAFPRAIEAARGIFDLALGYGYNMKLLDIGGGFPGHNGPWLSFPQIAESVNIALDRHFPNEDVEIIAEPGRFFVSSAFTLVTSVIAKRTETNDNGDMTNMYYVDDGVYGSFNCVLHDHALIEPPEVIWEDCDDVTSLALPGIPSSVWGPTCDSLDLIIRNVSLPDIEIGQWVYWKNMGAYTVCAATTFNGFPLSSFQFIIREYALTQLLTHWQPIMSVLNGDDISDQTVDYEPQQPCAMDEFKLDYPVLPFTAECFVDV